MNNLESDKSQWLRIVKNNPSYCFFDTPYWFDIHAQYYRSSYYLKKTLFNGSAVILPVFRRKLKGIIPVYSSAAFGTYGSLITDLQIPNKESESLILDELLDNKNYDYVGSPLLYKGELNANLSTQVIDLTTFRIDNISKNHQASIRKAIRSNLQIEESNEIADWKAYFSIYSEATKLRGENASNNYHWRLFKLIFELNKDFRKLWVIKEENTIIGGAIFFYFNIASYWHGANNKRCKQIGGSHLLHAHVIDDSKAKGYRIYDLCPSGGHKGVDQFKAGFNSKKLYFRKIEHRNKMFKFLFRVYKITKSDTK
jgi:hypothetical protein